MPTSLHSSGFSSGGMPLRGTSINFQGCSTPYMLYNMKSFFKSGWLRHKQQLLQGGVVETRLRTTAIGSY